MLAASILRRTFLARVKLDDAALADSLPAGSTGTAAIFTDRVKAARVIRKVLLRQIAITNYINPFRPGQKMTTDPGISGANNGAD